MIIIRIYGGLGNQLFQYAAASALAEKQQEELKLDVTGFANYQLRNFDLAKFKTPFAFASPDEIAALKATSTIQRLQARFTSYPNKLFYKEPFFHFDPSFSRLGKNVYLQGYFQSEKYFLPIENKVKKAFDSSHLVAELLHQLAAKFGQENSVSLHIRRGDYNSSEAKKVHGVLPLTYYRKAIEMITTKLPDAKFYLFSDDPLSAKEELQLTNAQMISGKITSNHFEDLYLMSHCRHNIVANSSYSWWGAWLNNNSGKIVIAPKNWFNEGPKDTQDLLPQSWIAV